MTKKQTHGGTREGAGAPKKPGYEKPLRVRWKTKADYQKAIENTTPEERAEAILFYAEKLAADRERLRARADEAMERVRKAMK